MVDEQFITEVALRLGVTVAELDGEDPKEIIRATALVCHDRLSRINPELKPLQDEPAKIKKFWKRVNQLKQDFPANVPVAVNTKPFGQVLSEGKRMYGLCSWYGPNNGYRITIERNQDVSIMLDTLWHEYAHALVGVPERKPHPLGKYWRTYGKIYNYYQDEHPVEEDDE